MDKILNLIALANDELDAENYEEAERLVSEVLKEDREQVEAWIVKAKVSYFLNRGLSSSYKYLGSAKKVSKGDKDDKSILEAFSFVTYKELRWHLSQALDRLPDEQSITEVGNIIDLIDDEGEAFLSSFKDKSLARQALNRAKNDLIKYASVEIKRSWDKVAREYYHEAISDYGKSWETNKEDVGLNIYRPSKYNFEDFTDCCDLLANLCKMMLQLNNEECDYDALIKLGELGCTLLKCCNDAAGYEAKSKTYDVEDDEGNPVAVDSTLVWRKSIVMAQVVKDKRNKYIRNFEIDMMTLKERKRVALENIKRRQRQVYWQDHEEEYAKLLAEKDATVAHKKELEKELKIKEKELEAIKTKTYTAEEEKKEIKDFWQEISAKKKQLKSLGVFKIKEKSALKEEIKAKEYKLNEMECARNRKISDFEEEHAKEVRAKESEKYRLINQISECDKILDSLNKKFMGE